jgi:hypothetical protein
MIGSRFFWVGATAGAAASRFCFVRRRRSAWAPAVPAYPSAARPAAGASHPERGRRLAGQGGRGARDDLAGRLPREAAVLEVLVGADALCRLRRARLGLLGGQRAAVLVEADRGLELPAACVAEATREWVVVAAGVAAEAHLHGDGRHEHVASCVERQLRDRLFGPGRVAHGGTVLREPHAALRAVDRVAGRAPEGALLRESPVGRAGRGVGSVAVDARLLRLAAEGLSSLARSCRGTWRT